MFIVSRTILLQSLRTVFGGVGIVAALNFVNPQFGTQLGEFIPALFSGEPLEGNPVSLALEWKVGIDRSPIIVGIVPFMFGIFAIYTLRSFIHKVRKKEDSVVFFFRTIANFIATLLGALPGFVIGKTAAGFAAVGLGASRFDPQLALRNFDLESVGSIFAPGPEGTFSFAAVWQRLMEIDWQAGTNFLITEVGKIEFEGYAALARGDFQSNQVLAMVVIWLSAIILGVLGFYLIRGILYGVYRFFTLPFRRKPAPEHVESV